MNDQDNNKNPLRKVFPNHSHGNNQSFNVEDEPDQYYAVGSENDIIKRFDIVLRSGDEYSIPYSLLPIYKLSGGKTISIITYDMTITIQGRNLAPIKKYLSKENILWLKESPSQIDDRQVDVFISQIDIQGETLNKQ